MDDGTGPTDGLLAGLVLVLAIGALVGILIRRAGNGTRLGLLASIALGVIGAFVTGFLLPMSGLNLSGSFLSGAVASAGGAMALVWIVKQINKE